WRDYSGLRLLLLPQSSPRDVLADHGQYRPDLSERPIAPRDQRVDYRNDLAGRLSATDPGRVEALVAQLDVPVGQIDKVPPAFMLRRRKGDMNKRTPFGPLRPAN